VKHLTRIPIAATPAWIAAVEAADCQCQCTTAAKGHTHAPVGGRCTVRQGEAGGRLHVLADGAVLCHSCANRHERATANPAPVPAAQEALFELPAGGA
jgi:hypothetical protein